MNCPKFATYRGYLSEVRFDYSSVGYVKSQSKKKSLLSRFDSITRVVDQVSISASALPKSLDGLANCKK